MASACPNPYEEQLYSVFRTFTAGDEDALERPAALQLCDTLQLEDRGAALVDSLFQRAERVSFTQFRAGLLSALGEPSAPAAPSEPPADHSDDDSSGREVAPKFVFGAKKYGRRSRPQRVAPAGSPRPRGASESRLDSARSPRARCKRSASAMESRDDAPELDHDRPVDRERALQLCRGLRMSGVDSALVDRAFAGSAADEISVGEFFDRLNASLSSSIAESRDAEATDAGDALSGDAVAEAWERAGVQRPRRLLAELGFAGAALRPHELERALEDEMRALPVPTDRPQDARALLLLAARELARLRLDAVARLLAGARAERDKLRDDLAEANRRARLLAQDVDDNHARLEAELQAGLRQLETRHADAARALAAETAAERERAAAARLALEAETARRVDAEARLRSEAAALRDRTSELQEQAKTLEARAATAEREAARASEAAEAAARREAARAERAQAEGAEAAARLGELRADNQRLRDRVDELAAALEASARRAAAGSARSPSWLEEVAMHASPARDGTECPRCRDTRDALVALQKAAEESSLETVGPEVPGRGASRAEAAAQTDPGDDDVEVLLKELCDVRQKHDSDKENMSSVIKELQLGLERQRAEAERAEEYWACKLDDEREMFAEEQRAGDERLAELVAKIAEYERQFARPAALPTIDESAALERQFTDLELEFRAYRTDKEAQLAARAQEAERLQRRLDELERRLAERRAAPPPDAPPAPPPAPPPPPACACGEAAAWARWRAAAGAREAGALRARAARAERAAQRLHARLAAADLLVKDLYIENCRLAHAPHQHRLP